MNSTISPQSDIAESHSPLTYWPRASLNLSIIQFGNSRMLIDWSTSRIAEIFRTGSSKYDNVWAFATKLSHSKPTQLEGHSNRVIGLPVSGDLPSSLACSIGRVFKKKRYWYGLGPKAKSWTIRINQISWYLSAVNLIAIIYSWTYFRISWIGFRLRPGHSVAANAKVVDWSLWIHASSSSVSR